MAASSRNDPLVRFLSAVALVCASWATTCAQHCPVMWGPILQISNTPFSAYVPKLAVVDRSMHVIYQAGWQVYYRHSTDCGKTWGDEEVLVPYDSIFGAISKHPLAVSGNHVYVVYPSRTLDGHGKISLIRSTNGGTSWLSPQDLIVNPPAYPYVYEMVTARGADVYVTVAGTGYSQMYLTRSSDGGATWDSLRQISFPPYNGVSGGGFIATESSIHLAIQRYIPPSGSEIIHLVSTDRGTTWSPDHVLSIIDQYRAWSPDLVGDDSGTVYVIWQDAKYGSSSGYSGTVLLRKSTDNGLSWSSEARISELPSARFSSINATGKNVYVVWDDERNGILDGTIRSRNSTDGGESWCNEANVGDTSHTNIDATVASGESGPYLVWASLIRGGHYSIYSRRGMVVTGVRQGNHLLPEAFTVSSFYPNPCNPRTQSQYAVPSEGRVVVAVFDVLGQKVQNIVDQTQTPGVYYVELSGTHLASGVYYVRFHFNSQLITKAVVLMR